MNIELFEEIIIRYTPIVLMVVTAISNFVILIKKIKGLDYKTPLEKTSKHIEGLLKTKQEEINTLKDEVKDLKAQIEQDSQLNKDCLATFEEACASIDEKIAKQNEFLSNLVKENIELRAELRKKQED